MGLTARERILLHLAEFPDAPDAFEVPAELSLEGVSRGAHIEARHLAQFARPLLDQGMVQERRAHVQGFHQRRKVYGLTDVGKREAYRLRRELRSKSIAVRDASGFRESTVGEVLRAMGPKASLLALLRQVSDGTILRLDGPAAAARPSFVEAILGAPTVGRFVGREPELAVLLREDEGPRVLVVRGVVGIGKSWLAARACALLHGQRNLFWHRVRPWDTSLSILASLGNFLSALGRPSLAHALNRGEAGRTVRIVAEDLPGTRSFLVFDDGQEASPEALAALEVLTEAITGAQDVRILILTRRNLPFYDRRDVVLRGLVGEIDLGGLTPDQMLTTLRSEGRNPPPMNVLGRLGGHPLFLELVRSDTGTPPEAVLKDVRRFIEEEIYSQLSDSERRMMKLASLYEVPVPREAFFADPDLTQDVLAGLVDQSLIQSNALEGYGVHDSIRDFFSSVLTPAEAYALGAFALLELRRLAATAQAAGRYNESRNCLRNAVRMAPPGEGRAALWEAIGDVDEEIGDLPATVEAYKQALKETAMVGVAARVHRKAATAFEKTGRTRLALLEIDAGLRSLGEVVAEERGWLDLVYCRVLQHLEHWGEARVRGLGSLRTFETTQAVRGQVEALLGLGAIEIHSLDASTSLAASYFARARDLSATLGDEGIAADVYQHLAHLFAYHGCMDPEAAEREIAALAHSAEILHSPHLHLVHRLLDGWYELDFRSGFAAARERFAEAAMLARKMYDSLVMASAHAGLASVSYFEGRFGEAQDCFLEAAVGLTAPASMVLWGRLGGITEAMWMATECSLLQGDLHALQRARKRFEAARTGRPPDFPTLLEVFRALGCLMDGALGAAEDGLRRAVQVGEAEYAKDAGPYMNYAHVPHMYLGVLLRILGRPSEASQHIARAREVVERAHHRSLFAFLGDWESRLMERLRPLVESARSSEADQIVPAHHKGGDLPRGMESEWTPAHLAPLLP